MRIPCFPLFLAAASLTGCFADVNASSRTYLGPSGSGVVVNRAADKAALEVVRLLELRGYTLNEMVIDTPEGERRLKLSRANPLAPDDEFYSPREVGSVFYAWVTPDHDGTGASVSLLGKPTLAGVEPCTNDGVLLNCTRMNVRKELAERYLRGVTETEVAHGVLSELALEGYVVRPMAANSPPPTPDVEAQRHQIELAECHARQHDVAVAAGKEKDPYKHTALILALPHCEDDKY